MTYEKTSLYSFAIHRFRDGDTVEGFLRCSCCGSAKYDTVRLIEIESHEPKGPDKARAVETAEHLTNLYRGKSGILTAKSLRRDRYGRILSDIVIDGTALSLQLVATGRSWWGVGEPDPGIVPLPRSTREGHS